MSWSHTQGGLGDARHTRHIMDPCLVQALPTWALGRPELVLCSDRKTKTQQG